MKDPSSIQSLSVNLSRRRSNTARRTVTFHGREGGCLRNMAPSSLIILGSEPRASSSSTGVPQGCSSTGDVGRMVYPGCVGREAYIELYTLPTHPGGI